tara:strand:+ start:41 stop:586 length:546 start_codon:yes stop_codon:yes gene_type:complete
MEDREEVYLNKRRKLAEELINSHYQYLSADIMRSAHTDVKLSDMQDVAYHDLSFHKTIWKASTQILPSLEVQVIVDAKNQCFVTTGSSGYVEFGMNPPVGCTLPIRCWIHTHPFGAAYFSGIDIKTVSTWVNLMETAYVLGGDGHYGFWEQGKPNELEITTSHKYFTTQEWEPRRNLEEEE